jgi:hypothetical protein
MTNQAERRSEARADMNGDPPDSGAGSEPGKFAWRDLPPAARRALAEAEARRAERRPESPNEVHGRGGLDPTRYGDWEVKGLASDF